MQDVQAGLGRWLDRLVLRSTLTPDECEAVLALPGKAERVKASRDFVRLGEDVDHSCLVLDGIAGRFGQARSGERLTTAIHIPGDMADLHSAVLPKATSALQSLGEAHIYRVPHRAIMNVAEGFPALAQAFWRDCTVDAAIIAQWALTNARQHGLSRIAHLLAEYVTRTTVVEAGKACTCDFPLTQAQLGDATNLTSVHVNRMMRQLQDAGVAEVRAKRLHVLDWDQLQSIGEFDPTYLHLKRAERAKT
jgi:CRP-like cAMP-binding protein